MMRSASRQALATLQAQQAVTGPSTSASASRELAEQLYAIGALLVAQPRLRRALGDPATVPESRAGLLDRLMGGKVGSAALDTARAAVRLRWSSPWDLADAIETAGDDALFAAAEQNSELDRVEDDLFRFERILQTRGDVVGLLDDQSVDPQRRTALLDDLVGGKVADTTTTLLRHAVTSDRKRSVLLAIDDLLEQAAARRERSVARVVSAAPLTERQQERLAAALSHMYGRAISIRTALDPALRGGLVVRVGDEVIDGSIATRFLGARAALT